MALTRIRTGSILDREVRAQDLADGAVTFDKINVSAPASPGYVLTTDGSGSLQWTSPTGTPIALNTLTDVDTTGALNGDSLVYNSVSGQWEPGSNVPSSLGLNSLVDVTITSVATDNFLRYNGSEWINTPITVDKIVGIGTVAITNELGSLDDVDFVIAGAPTAGDVLRYAGDRWYAGSGLEVGSIGQLDDVDLTGLAAGYVLSWNGVDSFVPVDVGVSPSSSNTFVVDDITARDALTPSEGDAAFVRTGSSGEYELYVYDSGWILLATQDSAHTDANTFEYSILYTEATASPITIGNVSQGSRVTTVVVEVITAFNDATSSISVGDAGDAARLLTNNDIDLTEVGTYITNVDYIYTSTVDTNVLLTYNFSTSTQGEAKVTVTHV